MARSLEAERGAGVLRDQGIVHLEELGSPGPAGQAQDPGERALPGLPGRRDHVVVELAGQEHLVRGRLDLGDQGNSPPDAVTATCVLPRTKVSYTLSTERATFDQ